MDVCSGRVVLVFSDGEAARLAAQLKTVIERFYNARSVAPPSLFLAVSGELSRATAGARSSPEPGFAASPQVRAGTLNRELPGLASPPSSDQPVTLTAAEAALVAGVSHSYLTRVVRRGDVQASRDCYGAWQVDADSLAAWQSRRRRERASKAA